MSDEQKFTPGPLEVKRATKPDNTGGYDWCILDSAGKIIAETFDHVAFSDDYMHYQKRPAELNARLFAAAPELLDVANEALAFLANPQAFDAEQLQIRWLNAKHKAEGRRATAAQS